MREKKKKEEEEGTRRRKKRKKKNEEEEKRRGAKSKFSLSIFLTVRQSNGTLWLYLTLD